MIVTNEIEVYGTEKDGGDVAMQPMRIISDGSGSRYIWIEVGGHRYPVLAIELIRAIVNAEKLP